MALNINNKSGEINMIKILIITIMIIVLTADIYNNAVIKNMDSALTPENVIWILFISVLFLIKR
jgi:hypothetical protein